MSDWLNKLTIIELLEVKKKLNEEHVELEALCSDWDRQALQLYNEFTERGLVIDTDGVLDVDITSDAETLNNIVKH